MRKFLTQLVFVISLIVAAIITFQIVANPPMAFNSELWKRSYEGSKSQNLRARMLQDLWQHYRLEGRSRRDVEILLGKPTKFETAQSSGDEWVYWVGPEGGFISVDSEWLCLKFNSDVVVRAYERPD